MKVRLEIIQKQIADLPAKQMDAKEQDFIQRYLGTSKKVLGVRINNLITVAKDVVHGETDIDNLIRIIDGLLAGKTFEEHAVGAKIFVLLKPEARGKISFSKLASWLEKCQGWVEIDTICQNSFSGKEVLERWGDWEKAIKKFRKSANISLRRASLVLQVRTAKEVSEPKQRKLAFETIELLKSEKEVLITKAISWLLRNLSVQDKNEVKEYLIANESTLPRIAFRETMKKIETGRKTTRKK
jgi:3-methyladenine DNA glycosylase AlkD